jgi:small subunit ribosomal protein S5
MPYEEREPAPWIPKTELGRAVAEGRIASIDEVLASGKRILEVEIADKLLPDLKEEVLEVTSTQRMTASGRKQRMRVIVVVGNKRGYAGVGVGKAAEVRDAIAAGMEEAKRNLVRVPLGCGSWECKCGTGHSIPRETLGSNSSTKITIKPAPKGVGLVAGKVSRKVLELAGIQDAWSFSKGRTRNVLNMVLATLDGLNKLNQLKVGASAEATAAPATA